MTDVVPVRISEYVNPDEAEIDDSGDVPYVTNHDELETRDVIRAFSRDSVEANNLTSRIVTEDDAMWRDEFADLELGDEFAVHEASERAEA
ncbi:hypothetical protein [Halobaculum sp. P14]|uniref:hypothetical protein n=1 Tax=Halobaculum sp. P14 TaxID=3421638 RepID=UPI003EBC8D81